jgi:hypothetical protein
VAEVEVSGRAACVRWRRQPNVDELALWADAADGLDVRHEVGPRTARGSAPNHVAAARALILIDTLARRRGRVTPPPNTDATGWLAHWNELLPELVELRDVLNGLSAPRAGGGR